MASGRADDQTAPLDLCIREDHTLSQDPIDPRVSWSPFLSHIWNGLVRPGIYVDDLIVTGSDLFERFEIKQLGESRYFLRIEVLKLASGIYICLTTSVRQQHAC